MEHSLKKGITFGLTSATITTLGLMVGLEAGTGSHLAVLGGILTIALADAASDALGIHISEESESEHTSAEIWTATGATFFSKLLFALTFVIPVLAFDLATAVKVSFVWGMLSLTLLSYYIAKMQGEKPAKVIGEHLVIASTVVMLTYYLGKFIAQGFG